MKTAVYIPPSTRSAEKHLAFALKNRFRALTKQEFVRGWCSLFFLFPGLHPDGFASRASGWPRRLRPYAAEAWRRFESGELSDSEFYCYRASRREFAL